MFGANKSLMLALKNEAIDNPLVVIPKKGEIVKYLEAANINYIVIPHYPQLVADMRMVNLKKVLNIFVSFYLLSKFILSGEKFIRVYSNSFAVEIGFYLSKLLKVEHVWHIREFGDRDYGLIPTWTIFKLKRRLDNSKLIFVSKVLQDHFYSNYNIENINSRVIYNGVEGEIKRRTDRLSRDTLHVGMIGYFHPGKGYLEVIEEISKSIGIKSLTAHLAGGMTDHKKEIISKLVRSDMVYNDHGYVKDPKAFYNQIDVLIVPSFCEAFGRVTVEALFEGIIVLGRNTCGTKEILDKVSPYALWSNLDELKKLIFEVNSDFIVFKNKSSVSASRLSKFTSEGYGSALKAFLQT